VGCGSCGWRRGGWAACVAAAANSAATTATSCPHHLWGKRLPVGDGTACGTVSVHVPTTIATATDGAAAAATKQIADVLPADRP